MMATELRPNQSVYVGEAKITLQETRGKRARLIIDAPMSVKIETERNNCRSDTGKTLKREYNT